MTPVQNFLFEKRYHFSRFQFNLAALIFVFFGFIFATYVGTSKIQEILAFDDTTNTWTFNSANAGQFTYDSGIITVDNSGARPTNPNKLANPSFNSDNSSWSTAAMPPAGWSEVPGDGLYSTSNFLVMKYEAKCALNSDPTTGLSTPNTGTGLTYADNTTNCTTANSRQVVSVASGYPIANISQINSAARCTAVTLNGSATHLINNNEWMTMARNMENVNADWTSGTAGTGAMFSGHNDNSPATSLQASTDDSQGYTGTGNSSGSSPGQKRTMVLSNGSTIWDMSGNVYEWVNNTIERRQQPVAWNGTVDDATGFNYSDYASGSLARYIHTYKVGSPLQQKDAGPSHTNYNANQGVGRIYHYSDPADSNTTTYGFFRGGLWVNGTYAGVFYL